LAASTGLGARKGRNHVALHGHRQWQVDKEVRGQEVSCQEVSCQEACGQEVSSQEGGRQEGGVMMSAPSREDVLQKIAEAATDSAAKQYDDYSKTFVALDGKAQAASTSAGVLLGVIVALANAGKLNQLFEDGGWTILLLLLPILAALTAMVLGGMASRVAKINVPFDAERQIKEFDDLRGLKPEEQIGQEDIIGFHVLRHKQWKESLAGMADVLSRKGSLVHRAQWAVLSAAVLTVLVFGLAASA
jgi:hypothetical protein